MKNVVLLLILFSRSLSQDTSIEERKENMVVKILNAVLTNIGKLTADNIIIPLVDLGSWGRLENVTLSLPIMTNWTDGVGSFGFQLHVNVSEIKASGYYNVGIVDVPGLFPIFGKGDFAVFVDAANLRLKIRAKKNFEADKFDFFVDTFTVQVVNAKVNFENLMGDPHVSDFLNELLGVMIPSLVEALLRYEPVLKNFQMLLDHYGNGVIVCIETQIANLKACIKDLFDKPENGLRPPVEIMAF